MAANDIWADFENLRHTVKHNTVDKLKQILTGFNEQCQTVFHKSGKKQDLIDRIVNQMEAWRQANNVDKWTKAQAILYQVRNSGIYSQSRMAGSTGGQPVQSMASASYAPTSVRSGFSGTTTGRYDPYAPPRMPPAPVASTASTSVPKPTIRFKPSPFFKVDQAVSGIAECPESTSSTDRKQQMLTFTLNSEQTMKLASTSTKYQLRLYCTTSTFYSPNPTAFRPPAGPCPIEFPPTCEVRVNGTPLQANLKGLKKRPGTAPPADLGKTVRTTGLNRVEMVYVNSQQPVQPKKFYMTVMLVEATTVAQLVDRLKKGKYRSGEDILAQMAKTANDDDEIVAGPQKMSLKCPLSFMRIQIPCRSALCVHSQCFDATSWFACMEQTTTWLCPVCEKILNYDELIIDGYFDTILKDTPEEVEDVIVENDGQWHTNDDKYASAAWRAAHPSAAPSQATPPRSPPPASGDEEAKNAVEILVLDSDDEDEGVVKRELSVSHGSIASSSVTKLTITQLVAQRSDDAVIDLTADSDDERHVPMRTSSEKRKAPSGAPSPTEQIWKKSRTDSVPHQHHETSSQLPPVSPGAGSNAARPAGYAGYPGGPTLPPLPCVPATTHAAQTYRGGTTVTSPRENPHGPYDHYNEGTSYYGSRAGGSAPRPGMWP